MKKLVLTGTLLLSIVMFCSAGFAHAQGSTYEIIIKNGRILDGAGNVDCHADIRICVDVIVTVGNLEGTDANRVIDAERLFISPGFIDLHSHADRGRWMRVDGGLRWNQRVAYRQYTDKRTKIGVVIIRRDRL